MEENKHNAHQAIFNLHNGGLNTDEVSETIKRLWCAEDDYSEGSLVFHLALAHFPPPQPMDFYVMALALINHREADKVPNLLKLNREDLGLWQAALELEAGYKCGVYHPGAGTILANSQDPFFQALEYLHSAKHLRRTNSSDRVEIKKRLHQALGVFRSVSAFETGRALLYLSQVESSYDTALSTAEQAFEYFSICKNKHYQSDTLLAIDSIREKHKERRGTSRSRSIDLGFLIRPLINATDTESFFNSLIQVLTSRTFLALDHVTVLYKTAGGEHIVASHHASSLEKDIPSSSIDLGSGYRLVVSQAADPMALEMILPLVKRELIRLSRSVPAAHIHYRRPFGRFTYYDSRMDETLDLLEMAARDQPEAAIMLRGEPGVGKTDLAYALHLQGSTKTGKFVVYDAATAVDKSFMVAELFGTVKGAFTDAQPRIGKIEEAGNGTLFIDEIGELTPQCQALLLRVLQNRQYQRMGTSENRPVTCRIILATNQPIEEWCQKPSQADAQPLFRPDLPSRFRHWIHVRSLHEIPDQIVPTAISFLREQGDLSLSPEAEIFLRSVKWIGNYRSLQNAVGLSVNMAKSLGVNVITPEVIHRAIGHHPLLFTRQVDAFTVPLTNYPMSPKIQPPPVVSQPFPAFPNPAPLRVPVVDFPMSSQGFGGVPLTDLPVEVSTLKSQASTGNVTENHVPSFSPPNLDYPVTENTGNGNPFLKDTAAEDQHSYVDSPENRRLFILLFKEIFNEFEFNRRKYFDFQILSNISQIFHQDRFPRSKTFDLIYSGLMKSPYVRSVEGLEKVSRLGKMFQAFSSNWNPPGA